MTQKSTIWLSSHEVCELLGIAPATLRKLVRDRAIQYIRVTPSGPFRFKVEWIEAYLDRNTVSIAA